MEDKLVDYILGVLDAEETVLVENALDGDAAIVQRLEVLRVALQPLQFAPEPPAPPTDLAIRTCQRIRELR